MERIDDLQTGGLRIIQDSELFCFSTDAVLLADYARLLPGENVLDLGAGSGILGLLMHARRPDATFTALELQPELYNLLKRNIRLNGLERFITPVLGDINKVAATQSYDVCVCNPPYAKVESGQARSRKTHDIARTELCITLPEICASAARALRYGGRFCICLPASRLSELIMALCEQRLEPKTLRLVHAAPGKEARLCLLMAAKGGHPGLRIAPPLYLRDENGQEPPELNEIYNRGEARPRTPT